MGQDYNRELICKDCVHSHRSWTHKILGVQVYQCRLPGNKRPDEYDPATGKTKPGEHFSCGVSRLNSGVCGPQAIHWTPRNSRRHLFTALKKNYEHNA
jgi:hypothetical protein